MLCQCVLAIDLWTPSYRLWRVGWEQREYHESALNRRSNTSRLCQTKANCACRYGMWLFGFIHSSCQSRIFLSFFSSLPTWNCRKSAETLPHRTFKLQHTLLETVDLVTVPRNFWHWSVSDIDHRQIGACCACSKCGTFLFAPLNGHCSMAAISGKDSPTHAASNSRSPFPHLCTEKLSRTCCACSRGGALFLPYRIQPHL